MWRERGKEWGVCLCRVVGTFVVCGERKRGGCVFVWGGGHVCVRERAYDLCGCCAWRERGACVCLGGMCGWVRGVVCVCVV